jgi:hypothetical protein
MDCIASFGLPGTQLQNLNKEGKAKGADKP